MELVRLWRGGTFRMFELCRTGVPQLFIGDFNVTLCESEM